MAFLMSLILLFVSSSIKLIALFIVFEFLFPDSVNSRFKESISEIIFSNSFIIGFNVSENFLLSIYLLKSIIFKFSFFGLFCNKDKFPFMLSTLCCKFCKSFKVLSNSSCIIDSLSFKSLISSLSFRWKLYNSFKSSFVIFLSSINFISFISFFIKSISLEFICNFNVFSISFIFVLKSFIFFVIFSNFSASFEFPKLNLRKSNSLLSFDLSFKTLRFFSMVDILFLMSFSTSFIFLIISSLILLILSLIFCSFSFLNKLNSSLFCLFVSFNRSISRFICSIFGIIFSRLDFNFRLSAESFLYFSSNISNFLKTFSSKDFTNTLVKLILPSPLSLNIDNISISEVLTSSFSIFSEKV